MSIRIDQLTQVAGATKSDNKAHWRPQGVRAFVRNAQLKISLSTILTIDLVPILSRVMGAIISAALRAIPYVGPFISGLGPIIAQPLSEWIATAIGDATGYGNPLRVGMIVDNFTDGGITIMALYMPVLLSANQPIIDITKYGSMTGTIYGTGENEVIEGATVKAEVLFKKTLLMLVSELLMKLLQINLVSLHL